METRIISNREECRALWEEWSPKESIYHLWDYREPFLDVYGFELAFTVFTEGSTDLGMLPLWFHPEQKRYLWFGDAGDEFDWQEDNDFWVKEGTDIQAMLDVAPKPLHLTALTPEAIQQISDSPFLNESHPKSVLPLKDSDSVEKYLEGLPKKIRQNTRRDKRRIDEMGLTLIRDRGSDFETLMKLNTATFDDSPFHDKRLHEVFKRISSQMKKDTYQVYFFTAELAGTIVGVDCIFFWNGRYYPLICGYDKHACPGIGHYMNLVDIGHAISLKARMMDFGETEAGMMKEKLFPLIPQFNYTAE